MAASQPKDDRAPSSDAASISALPECIKQEILMRLPIKEAVRTCILSKSWRHTWSTIPDVVVAGPRSSSDDEQDMIGMFVEQLLSCHKGNLRRFQYSGRSPGPCYFPGWLDYLSIKHTSELILDNIKPTRLYDNVFSCLQLKVLVLRRFAFRFPPEFNGFRLLRSLEVSNCLLPEGGISKLVSLCPVLQHLKLELLPKMDNDLQIHAPNLRELTICSHFPRLSLLAPKLCEVDFTASPTVQKATCVGLRGNLLQSSVVINHTLLGATHSYFVQEYLPTFNNLTTMIVVAEPSDEHVGVMDMLSQVVPTVQRLIVFLEPAKSSHVPGTGNIRAKKFPCLREVDIFTYFDSETVFGFAKFILSNAPLLQKVTIRGKKKDYEVLKELHELSTIVEIVFDESCFSYDGKFSKLLLFLM